MLQTNKGQKRKTEDENIPVAKRQKIMCICKYCEKEFTRVDSRDRHIAAVHTKEKHSCKQCDKTFPRRDAMERHFATVHSKEKKFTCDECNEKFSRKDGLTIHIAAVHTKEKYHCEQCDKKFPRRGSLERHIATVHQKEKKFTCDECNAKFSRKDGLTIHIAAVHTKEKYHCEQCDKKFPRRGSLERHIATVHQKEKKITCDKCNAKFAQKDGLKKHIAFVHNKEEKKFACEKCGAKFWQRTNLTRHILSVHSKEKRFECEKCGRCFGRKDTLDNHKAKVVMCTRRVAPKEIKCKDCGVICSTKQNLRKHVSSVHLRERPFLCHVCSFASNTRRDLQRHVSARHQPRRLRFKCFERNCGQCYSSKSGLLYHKASVHYNVWHVCKEFGCEKKFKSIGMLREHNMVVHQQLRRSCHVCAQQFTYQSTLRFHMKTMHGELSKPAMCSSCKEILVLRHARTKSGQLFRVCSPCYLIAHPRRAAERKTILFLTQNFAFPMTLQDKVLGYDAATSSKDSCTQRRPDFFYAGPGDGRRVFGEVDENQHKAYCRGSEEMRLLELITALGINEKKPMTIFRLNPDAYKPPEGYKWLSFEERLQVLLCELLRVFDPSYQTTGIVEIVYLFYDQNNPHISTNLNTRFVWS